MSEQKYNKYEKLFKAFKAIKKLGFDSKADSGKFSYEYVSLNKFKQLVDPILEEIGLGYIQFPIIIEGMNAIKTIIYDPDAGEDVVVAEMLLKPRSENNPQETGQAVTYTRRYSLFPIFGIVGDKDDDCLLSEEEIKQRVNNAKSISELTKIYTSIHVKQQQDMKELFSNKKRELAENSKKESKDIINNVEINEG